MDKILIFKNDMLGDMLHLSGCIYAIRENYKNSELTLVCSKNNYRIAKNFSFIDKFIILNHKSFFKTLFENFNDLLLTKYEHIFIFDGKNSSFRTSFFIRAKNRTGLCFWKKKKILGLKYNLFRPSKFLLYFFLRNYIICDEDYNNTNVRYQELYFKLLENLNIKLISKKNYFALSKDYKKPYDDFYYAYIKNKYVLFHFDEKWDSYNDIDCHNALKLIDRLSSKYFVVITTGIKNFYFLKKLQNLFCSFDFVNNKLEKINNLELKKILLLKNIPLDFLAHFISNSSKNITSHSGPIINISPVFNVKIIDIIKKKKFNELSRWIPIISNYKRYSFENLEKYINDI